MLEIMDMSFQPNFTMLTENLHNLFRLYIISGRIRAPPESELSDMIPTFQQGAKTNRRALQSKFKSWAKRMEVKNNNLVLASSEKLIVPKEKCDELIMSLHSEKHVPIHTIIFQVKQKYTWTKKNFGMDQDAVVRVISAHCKKEECWKDKKSVLTMREFSSYNSSRLSLTPEQSRFLQGASIGRPMILGSHKLNRQPMPFLPSKQFTSELYSYPSSINNRISERNLLPMRSTCNWAICEGMSTFPQYMEPSAGASRKNATDNIQNHHFENYPSSSVGFVGKPENPLMSQISQKKNHFLQALGLSRKHEQLTHRHTPVSTLISKRVGKSSIEGNDSSRKRFSLMRSCKKIKNIIEFKKLLKGAEENPKLYPAVLMNHKTKFLGSLSLAPRRICSRKMLSKFREELHKRQDMEKRNWYRGHKVLRDRNKLIKKTSQKHERFSYLSTPHKPSMRNVMVCINEGRKESKWNERVNRLNIVSNKANFLRLRYNEGKKVLNEVTNIHCLDDEAKVNQNDTPLKDTKDGTFASGNQAYSHKLLTTLNSSSVQEQPKQSRQEQCKDSILKSALLNDKEYTSSKNIQERMNLEVNILKMKFPSGKDLSQKSNPLSNILRTPQPQFPFTGPYLIPVSSCASNVGFLPPSSFPLIVRPLNPHPLINTQVQHMKVAGQSAINTPIVWGYLADGRVNVLKKNGNPIPESHLQSKRLPKNNECFIGNKSEGRASVLLQPYRLLAPKNNVLDGLQIQPNVSRKSDSEIRSNMLQKKPGGNSPIIFRNKRDISQVNDSTSKDVDAEMNKLTKWIRRMKLNVVPSVFQKNIEKSKLILTAELNYGIGMVREIRSAHNGIQDNL